MSEQNDHYCNVYCDVPCDRTKQPCPVCGKVMRRSWDFDANGNQAPAMLCIGFGGSCDYKRMLPNKSEQPEPKPNELPAVWDLVMADMRARDAKGVATYRTRLQPHNGRDALRDLMEELLDAVAYTRQLIYERDGK